jgi:hypothetical protein
MMISSILCLLTVLVGNCTVLACGEFPLSFDDPAMPKFKDYYYNCNFGYSVMIPKKLVAEGDSAAEHPVQQHGIGILLSRQPKAYIWVSGHFNAPEYTSLEEIATSYINAIKTTSTKLLAVKKKKTAVNRFPALRLSVKYQCPDKVMVDEYFLIIHRKRQVIYQIGMTSEESVHAQYTKVVEEIADTWQLKPMPCRKAD